MATIDREAIRAIITVGDLKISTPDVVSFNVRRSRGQMSATFSASLRVASSDMASGATSLVSDSIVIKAGVKGKERTIFTGVVQKVAINPIRTDASKVTVSLSGKDLMAKMEGQKINRRIKTYRDGESPPERWGVVTQIEEDNTPVKSGFGYKTFTKKTSAVVDIGGLLMKVSPDAFIDQDILKEPPLPTGSVSAENIGNEDSEEEES